MRRIAIALAALVIVGCSYQGTPKDLWGGRLEYYVPTVEDHIAKVPIGPADEVKVVEVHRDAQYCIRVVQVNPGKEIKAHSHAHHEEAIRIVRGTGMIVIAGKAKAAGPGDFFVIPAGVTHSFKNAGTGVCVAVTGYEPPFDEDDVVGQ